MGCVGPASSDAANTVYKGLKKLEYRGYDSAGIAVTDGNAVNVVKKKGAVEKLLPSLAGLNGNIAIGHTRWATHGKPSDANAHPHRSGGVCIVHNGIIENYAELREELSSLGETFYSETDSEVVAVLFRRNYRGDLLRALAETVKLLKGSYALMVICAGEQKIAAAKYKSPLIIGYGDDGKNYCASDEPALADKCKIMTVLGDGCFALISADNVEIYDGGLRPVTAKKVPLTAVSAELSLNGCSHYMLKELREVPVSVKNTVSAFSGVESKLKEAFKNVSRVIITGCGTAYHAGLIGKRYLERFAGIPTEVQTAGEFRYTEPLINENTLVLAISQSGETADTVEAARLSLAKGAKVVAVTNSAYSELTRLATVTVPVAAGPEICVAATKSYTGQIAALYLIAATICDESVKTNILGNINCVPELCKQVIENININTLAHMCAKSRGVYFMGRDLDYAVAREASLKLKEVSYIPSEGYAAGELKHGTLALIDKKTVSVVLITDKELAEKSANAVEQVLARKGKAAVITCVKEVAENFEGRAEIVLLPKCDKFLAPFIASSAVQYLAYRTAVLRRKNPDKPRNLAKSVTVE